MPVVSPGAAPRLLDFHNGPGFPMVPKFQGDESSVYVDLMGGSSILARVAGASWRGRTSLAECERLDR